MMFRQAHISGQSLTVTRSGADPGTELSDRNRWFQPPLSGNISFMNTEPDQDAATLAFYAREAPEYAASGLGGVSRHLHEFLKLVPPGGRVLELGCGGGRDSAEMLKLGFDVLPTDGVPEMARKAEERLGIPVQVMLFNELESVNEFDAVWAHASLLHAPLHALPGILSRIHRALKPGGHHFASYKSGGVSGRDNLKRYYNYVSREQLLDAYGSSGNWNILKIDEYQGGGYDGRQGPWLAITASKPD